MEESISGKLRVKFGDFEVDLNAGEVRRRGREVRLQDKQFQILALLLERAGDLVTREELRQRLWPSDTFVNFDANLNTNLNRLRRALGENANGQVIIKTIPRRGYQFTATVTPVEPALEAAESKTVVATIKNLAPVTIENTKQTRPLSGWSFQWNTWAVLVTCGLVAAIFLSTTLIWKHFSSGVAKGQIKLVVMPFDNLSGDPSQEYFSDGLTEEMITQLGRQYPDQLKVFGRTTTMLYKKTLKPPRQIARELGADVILEGSVRRSNGRVRITAQLFQAEQQTALWANTYEQSAENILQLQQDVAGQIAQSLALRLLATEPSKILKAPKVDPGTYDVYLWGLYEGNQRTPAHLNQGIQDFQTAIGKSPGFGPAYAELAYFYVVAAGWQMLPPSETFPKARQTALKALELDESLVEAHLALAVIHYEYDWNWLAAEVEFKETLAQNPNSANSHKCYAEFLMHWGRLSEAMAEMRRARDLDPLSPIINAEIGLIAFFEGDDPGAIRESQNALKIAPNFFPAEYFTGLAYEHQGKYPDAESHFRAAETESGNTGEFLIVMARLYAASGDKNQVKRALENIENLSKKRYFSPFALSTVYAAMGEQNKACACLHQAYEDHDSGLEFLRISPNLKPLHGQPCYEDLIKRLNFPE